MNYIEISTKTVKVRNRHRCEWCAEIIGAGEVAKKRAYLSDGDFQSAWQHQECFAAMQITEEDLNEGWEPGMFARGSSVLKDWA